ncbi:MAG: hypothetical protein M1828_004372 [Chrysothrix sp. TS-e1954]|nr:MAG: hypothetical protein M1828_004372 [Chrysothrix sp. TS-e1954]
MTTVFNPLVLTAETIQAHPTSSQSRATTPSTYQSASSQAASTNASSPHNTAISSPRSSVRAGHRDLLPLTTPPSFTASKLASSLPAHPFDVALPSHVPQQYRSRVFESANHALYPLVPQHSQAMSELLSVLRHNAHEGNVAGAIITPALPASSAFSPDCAVALTANGAPTLRLIYDHHTSLLDSGQHDLAHGRFVVVPDQEWQRNGVMIVEFDCDPNRAGTLGILRVPAEQAMNVISLLKESNEDWEELKMVELSAKWDAIEGYAGHALETKGTRLEIGRHAEP